MRRGKARPCVASCGTGYRSDLGVGQAREPMLVETFIAKAAVERFDIGVLIRLTGFDQPQRHSTFVHPCQHGAAAKFQRVVRPQHAGKATGDG